MKASTLKALRLPAGILLVFGILAIAVFIYSDRLSKSNPPAAAQITYRLDSASGLDAVNASGQHFTIDGLTVTADKLDLRYHVSGLSLRNPSEGPPPQCRNQPPDLINVASDGNDYVPYDSSVGGQQGNPTIQGEFIWRFTGKPPHHLVISVVRLECDTNASWTIHVDN
jgi:hypothetical protein